MKKRLVTGFMAITLLFSMAGCGASDEDTSVLEKVKYSNLVEQEIQDNLAGAMTDAGISDERQKVFFDHVNQFNEAVSREGLTTEFEEGEILFTKYDPYEMQDEWMTIYPDFLGYNCRITAFSLMGDYIQANKDAQIRDEMVMMDVVSLEEDSSAMVQDGDLETFNILFSTVPTELTKDVNTHVKNLQKDWQERGIAFGEDTNAKLIAVLFHESIDENENYLFIGHVGVLLPAEDNQLYFVEKIAFQEPYQLTVFNNRTELNDYLMTKYDINEGQPTAAPFIMENDQLMEGYRSVQ